MQSFSASSTFLAVSALFAFTSPIRADDDPFADVLISYDAGIGAAPGLTTPESTLGSPERFTGEDGRYPGVVSGFNPPYGAAEIVSIGLGGHLIVKFNTPVTNDPDNLYGIDLLIFGNTGFDDLSYPAGIVNGFFGNDGGTIEISQDGVQWFPVLGIEADGPMPTIGYVDSGPYVPEPGSILTNFTQPVDPALLIDSLLGLGHDQVIEKYRGSGGGVGIDISLAGDGLPEISFVRITNHPDALEHIEIDAFSDVPPRIPGDVDLNGLVNVDDLLLLIGGWGASVPGGPAADFDSNGMIDVDDLLSLIAHWSTP